MALNDSKRSGGKVVRKSVFDALKTNEGAVSTPRLENIIDDNSETSALHIILSDSPIRNGSAFVFSVINKNNDAIDAHAITAMMHPAAA